MSIFIDTSAFLAVLDEGDAHHAKAAHHAAVGMLFAVARKNLSLVDCVSFETMRLFGITAALTLDKHFKEQGFRCLPA